MTVEIKNPQNGAMVIKITGVASVANGGQGSLANPEGADLLITKTSLYIETPSTVAGNIDIGIGSAAADSTDIINALAMAGAITDVWYNGHAPQATAKTAVTGPAHWDAADVMNFTASSSLVGLVAYLFVEYYRIPE